MKEILSAIDAWLADGKRVAIARVIGIEESGPREPGAAMAVNEDGEVAGSVSGGCVEGAVVTEALEVLASGVARRCTFGYSDDPVSYTHLVARRRRVLAVSRSMLN